MYQYSLTWFLHLYNQVSCEYIIGMYYFRVLDLCLDINVKTSYNVCVCVHKLDTMMVVVVVS